MAEKKSTVLIVEDEAITALYLTRSLQRLGYRVYSAAVGEDAVRLAREHQPQAVLMDINLGGSINGLEVARRIAGHYQPKFIFMTGYDISEWKKELPTDFQFTVLSKPIRFEELEKWLEE